MDDELTPSERIAVANAQLDQLVASVHEYGAGEDLCSVRHLTAVLNARPCNQTVEGHALKLASMLSLALFRLAKEETSVDARL